jgi:hypothetical protein
MGYANLATITMTVGDGNGDYNLGNGDTSGRKLSITEQSGTGATTSTANHIAVCGGYLFQHQYCRQCLFYDQCV